MLALIAQLIPVFIAGLLAFLAYCLGKSLPTMGSGVFKEIGWVLDRTPALDAFLMFVLQAVLVTSAAVALFQRVSNHVVQSLDILYLASLLLLVLYHTRKDTDILPA